MRTKSKRSAVTPAKPTPAAPSQEHRRCEGQPPTVRGRGCAGGRTRATDCVPRFGHKDWLGQVPCSIDDADLEGSVEGVAVVFEPVAQFAVVVVSDHVPFGYTKRKASVDEGEGEAEVVGFGHVIGGFDRDCITANIFASRRLAIRIFRAANGNICS